ncbi:hypothetical protein [Clostridium sp. C105KSO13]|uniref:hypothetical protein n=1 Tax=Clostridium sp. C105KSO13 TaxID=1776045 RepID=UPI0007406C32|nr:hypothetical protein [Clostridium sp. C105KSO13]CUX18244.1 hypothetical protein BN3456_00265 [Clostridium sp. C105KSO13]
MARKKIVFVIVEGPSDDEALGVILNRLYDKNVVHVEITHGDITSELSAASANIAAKIGNLIRRYAKLNHYKVTDFQEIIHLIDMDGTYIPEECVVEDLSAEKPIYSTTEIRTARPVQLIARNKRKSDNVNRVCLMGKVWRAVPYHAYYMSSNLDHVLYNKLNSTDNDKESDSYTFVKKYKDHLDDFLVFISDSDFSVCGEFKQSWDFIKEGMHSLERHTNLGICFQEIGQKRNEEKEIED